MSMKWKYFNDQLALVVVILIFAIWVLSPLFEKWVEKSIPESVIQASIVIITLIIQFYFRRKEPGPPADGTTNGGAK